MNLNEVEMKELTQFVNSVQPLLLQLSQTPSNQLLTLLLQFCQNASPKILTLMEDRLLTCLAKLLGLGSKKLPKSCREPALKCTSTIISVTKLRSVEMFISFYTWICYQIYDSGKNELDKTTSEELKETVMQSLICLIDAIKPEDLHAIYGHKSRIITLSIGGLLASHILQREKSIRLK